MTTKAKIKAPSDGSEEGAMLRHRLESAHRNLDVIADYIRRLSDVMATEALGMAPKSVRPLIEGMARGPGHGVTSEDGSDLQWWADRSREFMDFVSGLPATERLRAIAALNAVIGLPPVFGDGVGATSPFRLSLAAESFGVLKLLSYPPEEWEDYLAEAGQRAMSGRAVTARLALTEADRKIKDANIIEAKRRWDRGEWPFSKSPKPVGVGIRMADFEYACGLEGWGCPSIVRRAIKRHKEVWKHPAG